MLTPLLSVLAEAAPTITERLSNNNLLFSNIEILLGAVIMHIAVRYGYKDRIVAAVIASSGIVLIIIYIMITQSPHSLIESIKQILPIITVTIWMLSAYYFRHRVNQELKNQKITLGIDHISDLINELKDLCIQIQTKHSSDLAAVNSRLDTFINQRIASVVSLSNDFPIGPRIQSGVTIGKILSQLASTSSAEQQRSIARECMGKFVTWRCKLFSWESIGNGQLQFSMGLVDGIIAPVFVSVMENEAVHLKGLAPYTDITVDGRIHEICTLSKYIRIDNAVLTMVTDNLSTP